MTARGGMTSHAAVVARGMGTCCVAGVNGIKVSEEDKTLTFADGTVVHEGDVISLDGSTGNVYLGAIATQEAELTRFAPCTFAPTAILRVMQRRPASSAQKASASAVPSICSSSRPASRRFVR